MGALVLGLVLAGCDRSTEPAPEVAIGSTVEALDDLGQPVTLRVDSIEADPSDPEHAIHLYGLSRLAPDGTWQRFCAADAEHRSAAIPVEGAWDITTGTFVPGSGDALTFACTGGAVGKCIRFGYAPWAEKDGQPLAPYHAACVRMVRADYCGDGRSWTLDGTRIDVYDRLSIQTEMPQPGIPQEFEAGWGPEGATYVRVPRWADSVDEVVAACPERLAGRSSRDRVLTATEVGVVFPETLLFNSRMRDPSDRQRPVAPISGPQAVGE